MLLVALIQRVVRRGRPGEVRTLPSIERFPDKDAGAAWDLVVVAWPGGREEQRHRNELPAGVFDDNRKLLWHLQQGRRASWAPPVAWEQFAISTCPADFDVWDDIRPWLVELGARLGGARLLDTGNNRVVYTDGNIPTGHVLKVSPGVIGRFQEANRAEVALWAVEDAALREFLAPITAHHPRGLWVLQVHCSDELLDEAANDRWSAQLRDLYLRGLDLTPDADAVNMGVLQNRYVMFDYAAYHVRDGSGWPTAHASPRERPTKVDGKWVRVVVSDWPDLPSYLSS
jgi:hypothetical protein